MSDSRPPESAPALKEQQAKIAELQKENFELKLRIYHLEECISESLPSNPELSNALLEIAQLKGALDEAKSTRKDLESRLHRQDLASGSADLQRELAQLRHQQQAHATDRAALMDQLNAVQQRAAELAQQLELERQRAERLSSRPPPSPQPQMQAQTQAQAQALQRLQTQNAQLQQQLQNQQSQALERQQQLEQQVEEQQRLVQRQQNELQRQGEQLRSGPAVQVISVPDEAERARADALAADLAAEQRRTAALAAELARLQTLLSTRPLSQPHTPEVSTLDASRLANSTRAAEASAAEASLLRQQLLTAQKQIASLKTLLSDTQAKFSASVQTSEQLLAKVADLEQKLRAAEEAAAAAGAANGLGNRYTPANHKNTFARHIEIAGLRKSDDVGSSDPLAGHRSPLLNYTNVSAFADRGSPANLRENVQRVLQLDEAPSVRGRTPLPRPHIVASSHPSSPAVAEPPRPTVAASPNRSTRAVDPPPASPAHPGMNGHHHQPHMLPSRSSPPAATAATVPSNTVHHVTNGLGGMNGLSGVLLDAELKRMLEAQQRELHCLHEDVAALRTLMSPRHSSSPQPPAPTAVPPPAVAPSVATAPAPVVQPQQTQSPPPTSSAPPAARPATTSTVDQLLAHNERLMAQRQARAAGASSAVPPVAAAPAGSGMGASLVGEVDDISLELLRQIERTRAALASSHVNLEDERRRFLAAAPLSVRASHFQ